jgi:hypothetical protein
VTALVQRQLPPRRPPLLPHALSQLPRRLEGRQLTPGILWTMAPRQMVLVTMGQRQNNAMTSELRLQQMARVFNATPTCASKETGLLQVTRTTLTRTLQPRRHPVVVTKLRKLALPRTRQIP